MVLFREGSDARLLCANAPKRERREGVGSEGGVAGNMLLVSCNVISG